MDRKNSRKTVDGKTREKYRKKIDAYQKKMNTYRDRVDELHNKLHRPVTNLLQTDFTISALNSNVVSHISSVTNGSGTLVVILRHGEKSPDDNVNLNPIGYRRAYALAPAISYGFGTPDVIYAARQIHPTTSDRPRQTITPLSQLTNVPITLTYTKNEVDTLASSIENDIKSGKKLIIVCWAHEDIPNIIEQFGVVVSSKWNGNVFDQYWILSFPLVFTTNATFSILPQRLLYGDSSN